jgi:hypothetical protein
MWSPIGDRAEFLHEVESCGVWHSQILEKAHPAVCNEDS